jgi:alpha-beta hydrolase superfamily lysophospholipase
VASEHTTVRKTTVQVDVAGVAPAGGDRIAADVFDTVRTDGGQPAAVAVCFPGGGMSRRYFDLLPPGEGEGFSMARHLVTRGFVVMTVDHLGVGESSRPDDPYSLTPDVVADVNGFAVAELRRRLRSGTLVDGLAPLTGCAVVGIGHSMGAREAVIQQARHRTFDALALLGIGGRGINIPVDGPAPAWLPAERSGVLSEEEVGYAFDPERLRRDLIPLARARYGNDPLPPGTTSTSALLLAGMPVPSHVRDEITRSATSLLGLCGLTAMIPGSTGPEMASVTVPVFLGAGARDITGPPHEIPVVFSGSHDVTLFVLPEAGHNHNVAPNRQRLWDRMASWMATLPPTGDRAGSG